MSWWNIVWIGYVFDGCSCVKNSAVICLEWLTQNAVLVALFYVSLLIEDGILYLTGSWTIENLSLKLMLWYGVLENFALLSFFRLALFGRWLCVM